MTTDKPEIPYVEIDGRVILIRPLDGASATVDEQYGAYLHWHRFAHKGKRPLSFDRWKRKSGL